MPRRRKAEADPEAPSGSGEISFDAGLEELETLVARLEEGELPLEESLAVFERGVRLCRALAERLQAAEERVQVLLREGGELVRRPFEGTEEPE